METLACSTGSRGKGGEKKICVFGRMSAKQTTHLGDFSLTGTRAAVDIGVSIFDPPAARLKSR